MCLAPAREESNGTFIKRKVESYFVRRPKKWFDSKIKKVDQQIAEPIRELDVKVYAELHMKR